jgi:hypothetical protein
MALVADSGEMIGSQLLLTLSKTSSSGDRQPSKPPRLREGLHILVSYAQAYSE